MESSVVSAPDWAGLQEHLLDIILEKLNTFSDCARFSAVCVPWFCVSMQNHKQITKKLEHQVPMLLYPKKGEEKGLVKNLYDVTTKRMIKFEVEVPLSTRHGGSSRGWLITMGEDFIVTLTNPTLPMTVIRLPPIFKNESDYKVQIRKAILSADPTIEPDFCTLVVIYGDQGQLAFVKPGSRGENARRWTYIDKVKTVFDDIIFYKGRLHASDYSCKAFAFDDDNIALKSSSVPRELLPTPVHLQDGKSYVVESLGGDLLMVYRFMEFFLDDDVPHYRKTTSFQVYKWDPSGPIWVKTKNLGGESLFLGDSMSTSVVASDFRGCCPNSIYFTHDFEDVLVFGDRGPIDSGVYDLENSSFTPHYETDEASRIAMTQQPPIWFVPNFLPNIAKIQHQLDQLNPPIATLISIQ